jgi:hypothetical protein
VGILIPKVDGFSYLGERRYLAVIAVAVAVTVAIAVAIAFAVTVMVTVHILSRTQKSYNQNLLYREMSTRSGSNLVLHVPINFIVTLIIMYTS